MKGRVRYYYSTEDEGVYYTGSGQTKVEFRPGPPPPPEPERLVERDEVADGPIDLLRWRGDARKVLEHYGAPLPGRFVSWERQRRSKEEIAPWRPVSQELHDALCVLNLQKEGDEEAAAQTVDQATGSLFTPFQAGLVRDKYILSDSQLGYAIRCLGHISSALRLFDILRSNPARERMLSAAEGYGLQCMRIGELIAEAQAKHYFLTENPKKAAEATERKNAPIRERRLQRMAELAPTIGVDNAAHTCAAEGLGKFDAIKRQWNRHKENRDT